MNLMKRICALATFLVLSSGCTANPAPPQSPPENGASDSRKISLGHARYAPELKIAQTLSPDASALSILFDNLQATADANGLGGAQLSALVAIPVQGEGGFARVSIDARGQTSGNNGDCDLVLMTPAGGTHKWTDADGAFILNLTADVPVPFVFRLAVSGLCWAPKSESFSLLAVDSLDVTIEPRPENSTTPPSAGK